MSRFSKPIQQSTSSTFSGGGRKFCSCEEKLLRSPARLLLLLLLSMQMQMTLLFSIRGKYNRTDCDYGNEFVRVVLSR